MRWIIYTGDLLFHTEWQWNSSIANISISSLDETGVRIWLREAFIALPVGQEIINLLPPESVSRFRSIFAALPDHTTSQDDRQFHPGDHLLAIGGSVSQPVYYAINLNAQTLIDG